MKLTEIKYKNKTIKVEFKNIEDYAVYHTTDNQLIIRKGLTKRILGRTLFHEIFHIIMTLNDFKVAPHGEERVAELTEEYYSILLQNKVLHNLINRCLKV
tara:strand:+ start:25 stop:324 length:300 start_codon:yes stop_codon:yes gene_type:complete